VPKNRFGPQPTAGHLKAETNLNPVPIPNSNHTNPIPSPISNPSRAGF